MLVMSLYNVIDRIFIGQGVGPEAISGLALTFPVMNLSTALGVLIGGGAAARTSILLGARDHKGAEKVLGNSFVLTLAIGTAYTLLFGIFVDEILRAFGASDVTLPYAREFMLWLLPGLIMTNLCYSFNNVMRASGYPMRAMATMFIGALLNLALAPFFLFYLEMGIKGAAIATDISMTVSAGFVMQHFLRKSSTVRFKRGIYGLEWRVVWGIIAIGAAPALVNAAACFVNMTINLSLVEYGTDLDVGAAGIFITYTTLMITIVIGIGMGMQPIVGYNYGAGRLDRLKRAYTLAWVAGSVICTVGCIFGLACPNLIAKAFTTDERMIEVTANGIRLALPMFWVAGFQIISSSFFQSIGKAGKSTLLGLTRQVICLYPMLLIFPNIWGLNGIWLSFPAADAASTLVAIVLIILQFRQIKKAQR